MEKYERMVEEGRRGPGQKDKRDKECKEEQLRLRNEKALQDHLDSVENQEETSKQTRQPQCKDYSIFTASGLKSKDPYDQQPVKYKGMAKVPPVQQAKVSNKNYSIFTASGLKSKDPYDQQPVKYKDVSIFAAGKNRLAKVLKPLVRKKR
ncbi:uncharacterized protein LOC127912056 isoform X7 [Oncorhynchus keta]|uniref:uncharacterized protein LOC127912056 isoform X7 n=1 Tax=Oncorhynchus keta TaxID=8018 RepID=UPI00227C15E3|nr:uncharacterized protein LOC127912056 isoform X7 [Oncorhynchus keta]